MIKSFYAAILTFTFCIFNFLGCSTVTECAKGVAGISAQALEDNRKSAIIKVFKTDYSTFYAKTLEALKGIGAYVYTQDIKKHLIAIYVSEEDTTPVGLFFKEIDKANTQIEVSSPSIYAREFISAKLFSALEKKKGVASLLIKED